METSPWRGEAFRAVAACAIGVAFTVAAQAADIVVTLDRDGDDKP